MPCFPGSWLTEEVTYLAWIVYTNYEDTAPPSVRKAMPLTQKGGSELLKCFETLDLHSADWQRILQPSPENKGRKVPCQGAARASSSLRDTRWHSLGTGQWGEHGRSRVTVQGQPRAWTTSQVHGELRLSQDVRLQVRPSTAGSMAMAGRWQCWSILRCHWASEWWPQLGWTGALGHAQEHEWETQERQAEPIRPIIAIFSLIISLFFNIKFSLFPCLCLARTKC